MKLYEFLIYLLVILLALAAAFGAGWETSHWKQRSDQLDAVRKEQSDQNTQTSLMVKKANDLLDKVNAFNFNNDQSMANLQQQLEDQSHAISNLRVHLVTVKAGTCSFTPDADSLLNQIYDSTLGAGPEKAAAGSAGVGYEGAAKTLAAR